MTSNALATYMVLYIGGYYDACFMFSGLPAGLPHLLYVLCVIGGCSILLIYVLHVLRVVPHACFVYTLLHILGLTLLVSCTCYYVLHVLEGDYVKPLTSKVGWEVGGEGVMATLPLHLPTVKMHRMFQ